MNRKVWAWQIEPAGDAKGSTSLRPMSFRRHRPTLAAATALIAALWLLMQPEAATALEYEMQGQHKCMFEEINQNVIVVGEFFAFLSDHHDQGVAVDVRVEDPHGHILFSELGRSTPGQFAFTTKTAGEYKACFAVKDHATSVHTRIKLDWRTGVAATDWGSVAKKEHLDQLSVELRKLEDSIREVYSEMLLLQQREQEMRDISEVTNTRVALFSIVSLLVCIASGVWQLWYLRRFFQRKKLL